MRDVAEELLALLVLAVLMLLSSGHTGQEPDVSDALGGGESA